MTSLEYELVYVKQQLAYYKGKSESYESMLIKANLIQSPQEKLIKIDPITNIINKGKK